MPLPTPVSLPTAPPASEPGPPANATPVERQVPAPSDVSAVSRLWHVFRREPVLLVTCSYLFISAYGLWDSYWYYRRFQIPILEFMQSSDYFVSGLRRPEYALLLAWILFAMWLSLLPERWRRRHPGRVAQVERRWWGRVLLPRRGDWWIYMGLHPETTASLVAVFTMGVALYTSSNVLAARLYAGEGHAISVRMSGHAGPMGGDWRLLGTSNAFMFAWNPAERRAEVLPIDSVESVRVLGWRGPQAAPAVATGAGAAR